MGRGTQYTESNTLIANKKGLSHSPVVHVLILLSFWTFFFTSLDVILITIPLQVSGTDKDSQLERPFDETFAMRSYTTTAHCDNERCGGES